MATANQRTCGVCRQPISEGDEWIALDGGEIWCTQCWTERFAGGPAPTAAAAPSKEASTENTKDWTPCIHCGHMCPPSFDICPACAGEPFKKSTLPPLRAPEAAESTPAPGENAPANARLPRDAGQAGWYYLADDQQVGPVPTEALGRMIRAGQVGENMMVWRNGMSSWVPLALIPELSPLTALAPGAIPVLPAAQEFVRHNGKSKVTAGLLALLIGGLGVHKFYLGGWGWGLLYLLFMWTFIPAIISFIEGIIYLTMSDRAFDEKYNFVEVSAFTW